MVELPFFFWFGNLLFVAEGIVHDEEVEQVGCSDRTVAVQITYATVATAGVVEDAASIVFRGVDIIVQGVGVGTTQAACEVA